MPAESSSSVPVAMSAWRARASQFFFLVILFSFPLFSVPCANGTCSSPSEVVAIYLYTSNVISEDVAKGLLYPGALLSKAESIVTDNQPPSRPTYDDLLTKFNFSKKNQQFPPPINLGFVLGCLMCLVGAALSMFGPSVFGLCGMLIVLFYIYREGATNKEVFALPMFGLAIFALLVGSALMLCLQRSHSSHVVWVARSSSKSFRLLNASDV